MTKFLTIVIMLAGLASSAAASDNRTPVRTDIFDFQVGQKVYVEKLDSVGVVVDTSSRCALYANTVVVQLHNGSTISSCGGAEFGPVPNEWQFGFNEQIPIKVGDTLKITDAYSNPGHVEKLVRIEQILVGMSVSNADPENKVIIKGRNADGSSASFVLNDYDPSHYRIESK